MYGIDNVRKFVEDNKERLGEEGEEIIAKAEKYSQNGILSGGAIELIMNYALAKEFHNSVTIDPEHIRIGLSQIRLHAENRSGEARKTHRKDFIHD